MDKIGRTQYAKGRTQYAKGRTQYAKGRTQYANPLQKVLITKTLQGF